MTKYDYSGKAVLISGAARGLGKRAAERFGQAGASLVLNDYSNDVMDVVSELKSQDIQAVGEAGDISREETSVSLVNMAKSEFGGLHVAINNAGIGQEHMFLHDTSAELARKIVDVDLMGVIYAMTAQLPLMVATAKEQSVQTSILNLSSAAGVMAAPKLAVYAAAKHGVAGLTRSAAIEYGRLGVRVNALCPAFARTNMVTDILDASKHGADEAEARLVANNPMRRLGEVEEVVQAMLWACSEDNSFYNGQTLSIDGGLRAF